MIAASAGNHALALAYHGQLLNIPVTVVMPVTAPIMKVSQCETFGATVITEGNNLAEVKILRIYFLKLECFSLRKLPLLWPKRKVYST